MATAIISEKDFSSTKRVKAKDYPVISMGQKLYPKTVKINEVLPFRISFTNVMIPSYSAFDVPPIGIAIVGYNNYIL